jgi:ABC-type nitrate/sulfonate/bicarbonate transport system substrate-binding protein
VSDITVGVVAPAFVNVAFWVARRHGLRAREVVIGSTEGVTRALRAGEIDIALSSPEGSIADAAAGGPLRVVAGMIDRPPLSLIALPRHRTFEDLRGGLIGTSSLLEGTRHVAERLLAEHGLRYPDDYDFAIEGSHVARAQALRNGRIDAALQMVPYDVMATDTGFTNLGAVAEDFAFSGVCASGGTDRGMLTDFLAALSEATDWLRDNLAESAAIAVAETSTDDRYALRACHALTADGVLSDGLRYGAAALDAAMEALLSTGQIGARDQIQALDYSCLP